ncbi:hypothetical protein FOA52_000014 [Chlamydomonas sp. UWO 241]|nr:hypothetical protein FOA52_000014 [Chlamydomonas sp. UWO 241]
MSSSPKKASLLGPVHELSAAVHGVRSDLAALQERHARLAAEHEAVTAECAGLRSAMLALSRLLQLPHDLALTLLGGAGGAGGWDGAISQLRDHVTSLLQHVHTAATEAAVRTVHVSGVEPLQARCAHLEAQLASVVSTLDDLRMGAAEGVAMHAAALQAMRTQLEAGAEEALSVALAMLRPEVAGMGDGAKALQRAMEGAWAASARAWSEHASAGAREAAAAVGALEGAAEELQASLQEQSKELEGAREELEGARAHAVAAAAADDAKAARARAESDALRGRVVEVEAARDVAEATAAAAVRSASRRSTLDLLPQLQLHTGEDGGSTGVGYT